MLSTPIRLLADPAEWVGVVAIFPAHRRLNQLAECGYLPIQEARVAVADKKLAAGRIRVLGTRHGEHPANVRADSLNRP